MRTRILLACAALVAASLAVAPTASAEVPLPTDVPYCVTEGCGPSPVACAERSYVVTVDTVNTVATHDDCSVDLETGKGVICVGAWTATDERDVGPVHWTRHYCSMPGGPLDGISMTSSSAPPCTCDPQPIDPCAVFADTHRGAVDVDWSSRCRVQVSIDPWDCLWGETWVTKTYGPLTVRYTTCAQPTSSMADPFPTCVRECTPPVVPDGCDLQAATPTTVGPFLIPFNPQQSVWGGDCDVDVDPIGACAPPSGSDLDADVAFVHVHLLLCGGDVPDWS